MENKPWYASKTIWASLIVVVVALLSMLGKSEEAAVISEQSEGIADWVMQLVMLVAGAMAFYGRISAKKVLTP
jgi:hypothetical protein